MDHQGLLEAHGIVTETLPRGARYLLPRRDLDRSRHLGWVLAGFGLVGILFMCAWMGFPIGEGIQQLQQGQRAFGWGMIVFGSLGLLGLIPMLGMFLLGLTVALNRPRCIVERRGGNLYSTDKLLFFSWRRKRPTDKVRQLQIMSAVDEKTDSQYQYFQAWLGDSSHVINAKCSDGDRLMVAPFYPRDLLKPLAEDLAERLESEVVRFDDDFVSDIEFGASTDPPRRIRVVDGEDDSSSDDKPLPTKPPDSDATIDRHDYGITIRIPPTGIWKGSRGLLAFALVWNLALVFILTMITLMGLGVVQNDGDPVNGWTFLFLSPFIAVGIAVLLVSINMGRRRAAVATADKRLIVVHESIFGKQVRQWTAEQIAEICVGFSGMEVNDVPVNELQIHPHRGNKFGMLSQRDDFELEWIAAELNEALAIAERGESRKLPLPASSRDEKGRVISPDESVITVDCTGQGVLVTVPPRGASQYIGAFFVGVILTAIGLAVGVTVLYSLLADGFDADDLFGTVFVSLWSVLFAGPGLMMLIFGYLCARRHFAIEVDGEDLILIRKGPLGEKRFHWYRSQIENVFVTSSGWQVNSRDYQQLSFQLSSGSPVTIMTGHSESDLTLVATAVNEQLNLGHGAN